MKTIILETLSSPGCHNCMVFKRFWNEIRNDWQNVQFKEYSITSQEGLTIVAQYQIFTSPGIILNGELFSTGAVNEANFIHKLTELSE